MSTLLLSGATMLADSCPDCNVPLFRKKKEIFCPRCGRKAIYAKSEDEIKRIEDSQSLSDTKAIIQDIVTGKINFLAQQLASSESLEDIKQIFELLDKMTDFLIKIKRLGN
ncbi:MAG: Sjogren's syndrome/scleroderma autoantigen 1 family protein [Candidatus Hodarchaeales archaeon]|jgi:UPF0148 protein